MKLTQQMLNTIREATIDESAFQRVVALFQNQTAPPTLEETDSIFNLGEYQTQLLSSLLDAIPVIVYIKDKQCRFVMVNRHSVENSPVGLDLIDKTDFDLFEPDVAQYYYDMEQEILRTGIPVLNEEIQFTDWDGNISWALISKAVIKNEAGENVGIIGVNLIITPQKLAEQSLEREHNLLKTVLDHIHDKIYVKDRAGRFVTANAATINAHNKTPAEHKGTTDFDYMQPQRAQRMFDEEQAIMESGIPIINQELHTPRDAYNNLDHDFWSLVSKVPIFGQDGEVTGLVGINRNITDRKINEQKANEIKLEQARIRILSNFMTHSSHEFRTPLSIIKTATYLMQINDNADKQQHYLQQINRQTEQMNHLIDNLQLMLRLDNQAHLETRPIYIDSTIHTCLNQAQHQLIEKQLTVNLIESDSDVLIEGERETLGIAISSILENAIRYTHDKGTITINYGIQDDHAVIRIQDNGIGMSQQTLTHIYERFYRADDAHSTSGFGLGLSITKRIIELYGGEIHITSQVGEGTTVTLRLPIRAS